VCIVHNCIVDKCMTCGILKFELVSGGRWALCIHSTKLANGVSLWSFKNLYWRLVGGGPFVYIVHSNYSIVDKW